MSKTVLIRLLLALSLAGLLGTCKKSSKSSLQRGLWLGTLGVHHNQKQVPFLFEVDSANGISLLNADEHLKFGRAKVVGDSVVIQSDIYGVKLEAVRKGDSLEGHYWRAGCEHCKDIRFQAVYKPGFTAARYTRFAHAQAARGEAFGRYKATFVDPKTGQTSMGVGEFSRFARHKVKGTFLRPGGDYRYLEGVISGDTLLLSSFDGIHIFRFSARIEGDSLTAGKFYSGAQGFRQWSAVKSDERVLADPEKITALKAGYEGVRFDFPAVKGGRLRFPDKKYRGKVVIIQIMGSWCPNCFDETAYLKKSYDRYHRQGLEIIGLAYEFQAKNLAEAKTAVQRSIRYHKAQYPFAIALFGRDEKPGETLPMLDKLNTYPTTLYIDRKGKLRKIHTGFSGPGTQEYGAFVKRNDAFIKSLLDERP